MKPPYFQESLCRTITLMPNPAGPFEGRVPVVCVQELWLPVIPQPLRPTSKLKVAFLAETPVDCPLQQISSRD